MDLALFQAIQLFCCSMLHHRSSKILECLLHFNTKQLLQHFALNLSPSRALVDRRNAADALSSLVLLVPSALDMGLAKLHVSLLEHMRLPETLPMLFECVKDSDLVLRSYATSILAALHVDLSCYVRWTGEASAEPSNGNPLSKILSMLSEKAPETREAALTAILCMGAHASGAVGALGEFLLREKSPQLRILACRALQEIGSPHALQAVHCIQELVRKDREESVKVMAQEVLDHLGRSLSNSCPLPSRSQVGVQMVDDNPSAVTEAHVRQAIQHATQRSQSATAADLKESFQLCHPALVQDNPRWKAQLRDTLRTMVLRGAITKQPATFSFPQ